MEFAAGLPAAIARHTQRDVRSEAHGPIVRIPDAIRRKIEEHEVASVRGECQDLEAGAVVARVGINERYGERSRRRSLGQV